MIDFEFIKYLEQFVTDERKEIFRNVLEKRTNHFTVAIEDIYQAHNASAVVRSCDIFGIQRINIIENKYKFRASSNVAKGAQKWIDFNYFKNKDKNNSIDCIESLKQEGYQIIATTPHQNSCMLQDFDITKKSAFFFGVEKEGLTNDVLDNSDGFLKIPMVGFTESLNISVAAAIILSNLTEKLRNSNVNWKLSQTEKDQIYLKWLEKSIKSINEIKKYYFSN